MIVLFKAQKGQSIVEIILAVALTAVLLPALLTGYIASREGKEQNSQRAQATAVLKEAVDAVRSVREKGWNSGFGNLAAGDYHPVIDNADFSWRLDPNPETIGNFTRRVTLADVYRDVSGNIAAGGTLDQSTKLVTVTVSWGTGVGQSLDSTFYLTRYLGNQSFTQTTDSDFNLAGVTKTDVVVSNNEIILGPLPGPGDPNADWCNPSGFIKGTLNLPKSGSARALWAIPGEAFVSTGVNSSGESMVRVTGLSPPPNPTWNESFDGYKVNDIFGETGYAYLATDDNQKEIVIISTTQYSAPGKFLEVGSVPLPGSTDANGVFVLGNVGYIARGVSLFTFNLQAKTGIRAIYDSVVFNGLVTSVYVVGNYAYVTTNDLASPMAIVDISNPLDIRTVGTFAPPSGTQGGRDIFVSPDGNRAYMVSGLSVNQPEFFIIDTSVKQTPHLVSASSSYDTGGIDPMSVDMVLEKNRAIIVGSGGSGKDEYQVVDLRNESNPVKCGGLGTFNGQEYNFYDVSTVVDSGHAYAYVTTADSSAEFLIIEGGRGNEYATKGIFESAILPQPNLTQDAAFNKFKMTVETLNGSRVDLYVGVADRVSGNCPSTFNYMGPFTTNSPIPFDNDGNLYENPAQCFRYKAELFPSGDYKTTPRFQDITINYTP